MKINLCCSNRSKTTSEISLLRHHFDQKKPVHSIGSGGRNRAASSEPTYRPQCRSTCNIVLTACTDLYPTLVCNGSDGGAEEESYNTTATCTVLPTTSNDQVHI